MAMDKLVKNNLSESWRKLTYSEAQSRRTMIGNS